MIRRRGTPRQADVVEPRRFGRGLTAGIVTGIVAVGAGTSALLYVQSERIAERQEGVLATRAARAVQTITTTLVASLGGASALVDDNGDVDEPRFDAFASGVVNTTVLPVLANVEIVPAADRAATEAELGTTISALVDGELVPSGPRTRYLVVRLVFPKTSTFNSLIGFDVGSDPARASAAAIASSTGTVAFSAPVQSLPGGQMSFFAITPLFARGPALGAAGQHVGAPVGYVASLVPASTMLDTISTQLPDSARVSISDTGEVLASTPTPPHGGRTRTLSEAGRTWVVTVEYHVADHSTALLSLIAALLLAAAVGVSLWRNMRQTGELRSAALGVQRLGELSERLAVADSRDDVLRVLLESAAAPALAATVAVATPNTDRTMLTVVRSAPLIDGPAAVLEVPASMPSPITDAWNTRAAVFVADERAFRGLYADGAQDRAERHVVASAAMPLRRPSGELLGVLAWEWKSHQRFGDGERSTMLAAADLVQQSLHRADLHEQRWTSASALLALSQQLSVARTTSQIAAALIEAGPEAAAADYVGVGFLNEAGNAFELFHPAQDVDQDPGRSRTSLPVDINGTLMAVLRRGQPIEFHGRSQIERFPVLTELIRFEMERLTCIPLIDSTGELRGVLAFVFVAGSSTRPVPDAGRLATIADVAAQTVERALLYVQEHELVVNLQRQTLADLPAVPGLDMAARYLPSSATLGLGGDWYDVYLLGDGRIGVVVGDVSGHGIDAIADMTEFRTTISTLLRTDQPLGNVPALSTTLLRDGDTDELRFATAGLMILDTVAATLSYIRAGHPPMLVRDPSGSVVMLESGGGAPIGITTSEIEVQTIDIAVGTVIVAYTDGLIERPEESIDDGLDRLRAALGESSDGTAGEIADTLVARCLGGRQTADDTALLVLVVTETGDGTGGSHGS